MIGLVDCNNFFASCESLFRPGLAKRPVAVLSANDGCVVARSEEVKALGITMGEPYFQCKERLAAARAAVFSSNFELYADLATRMVACLRAHAPDVEPYSIDESFIDVSGMSAAQMDSFLVQLRTAVERWTGIPVSIGAAPTKTLAKAANRYVKRNDRERCVLAVTDRRQCRRILAETPVGDVWGIGRALKPRLLARGITTALQLADLDMRWMRKRTGVVGERMLRELNGECCYPFGAPGPERKTLTHSRTFGKRISSADEIASALREYAASAAVKLRSHRLCAAAMHVFITTGSHAQPPYSDSIAMQFARPTCDTAELAQAAGAAARSLWRPGCRFRKADLTLLKMSAVDAVQGELDPASADTSRLRLMEAVDQNNARFGRNSIRFCADAGIRTWRPHSDMRSHRATTRISAIVRVSWIAAIVRHRGLRV